MKVIDTDVHRSQCRVGAGKAHQNDIQLEDRSRSLTIIFVPFHLFILRSTTINRRKEGEESKELNNRFLMLKDLRLIFFQMKQSPPNSHAVPDRTIQNEYTDYTTCRSLHPTN